MTKFHPLFKALAIACFTLALVTMAQAQATRTWVSGVGDDVNPCSRTAPCKTFAGAVSKTAVNGEINCLDPGGFGAVTITKSLTIDCEDTQGAILASSVSGVTINITTSAALDPLATVRLRGLSINGSGSCGAGCGTRTGLDGVRVSTANTRQVKVILNELFIHGFTQEGVDFNAPGGDLIVKDCLIVDNGASGIRTLSTLAGATGIIHTTVDSSTMNGNQQGVRFEGNSFGVIKNSTASNNTLNGFVAFPTTIGNAEMNIMDSAANNNRQFGVFAGGTGFTSVVRIFNVTAFHNTTLQLEVQPGGSILSNGKSHIGLPSDAPGVFTDQ